MRKIIPIAAILIGALTLIASAAPWVIGMFAAISAPPMMHRSVGIIGGADGPTAIFVANPVGAGSTFLSIVAGIFLIAIGIWGLKKAKKSDE